MGNNTDNLILVNGHDEEKTLQFYFIPPPQYKLPSGFNSEQDSAKRSDRSKHARELNMPPHKRGATDIRTYMHNDAQTLGAVAFRGPNFRCPNFMCPNFRGPNFRCPNFRCLNFMCPILF